MFRAPEGFPESLPEEPLNYPKTQRLIHDWRNVIQINDIKWEMRSGEKVCESMVFHTTDDRGFCVSWESGEWTVLERYNLGGEIVEIPCDENRIVEFVDSNTTSKEGYYVYVLECELPDEKTAKERAKKLYPPKSKEEVREYFIENNKYWGSFSESKKNKALDRESGFSPPSWYHKTINADSAYYVGYTTDVSGRVDQHLSGVDFDGAHFTEVFHPTYLVDLFGFTTKKAALEGESKVASEIGSGLTNQKVVSYYF